MREYEVKINPRVNSQLEEHVEFIARVSIAAAERFYSDFAELVKQLETAPFQFPACENPNLPENVYRRANFAKWYALVFSVEDHTVYVDAVLDGRTSFFNKK